MSGSKRSLEDISDCKEDESDVILSQFEGLSDLRRKELFTRLFDRCSFSVLGFVSNLIGEFTFIIIEILPFFLPFLNLYFHLFTFQFLDLCFPSSLRQERFRGDNAPRAGRAGAFLPQLPVPM